MVEVDILTLEFARTLGLFALAALAYSELLPRVQASPIARNVGMGVLFGIGAVLLMHDPVTLAPGVIVDARLVLLGLSGPFGGYLAAALAAAMASAYRWWFGGIGAEAGVIGIAIAASAGCLFRLVVRVPTERLKLGHLLVLGVLSSAAMLDVAFLPKSIALLIFYTAVGPIITTTILGVMVFGALLARECRRLKAENAIKKAAVTDSLTGLPNRRAFRDALDLSMAEARADSQPLSLLMIDADHFKRINDQHGHDVGDRVLMSLARALQEQLQEGDWVARLGGEEFAILLRGTPANEAVRIADRIRQAVESLSGISPASPVALTVSIGVALLTPEMSAPGQLMKAADEALYRAKSAGRNRVSFPPLAELASSPPMQIRAAQARA